MRLFGEILACKRKKKGLKQSDVRKLLAERGFDYKPKSISKWETDSNIPSVNVFFELCEILDITDINSTFEVAVKPRTFADLSEEGKELARNYILLLHKSGSYTRETKNIIPFMRKLPLYDIPASAGTGSFLDSDSYTMVEVGDEVSKDADFGVRITGDSMEPRFVDGQYLWIHKQEEIKNGEIGLFYLDGEAYCKRFYQVDDEMMLVSLNQKYEPLKIDEYSDFKVFGRVVG